MLLIMVISTTTVISAQDVQVTTEPYGNTGFIDYVSYYISGIDMQTGASNFQFFQYTLKSNIYPAQVQVSFTLSVKSVALGLNTPEEILAVVSDPFILPSAPVVINNRDLSMATPFIYDQASPPNPIPISVDVQIDATKFDALLSSVITSGKIVDGEYNFNITIKSGAPGGSLSHEHIIQKKIEVRTPTSIQLQSPGGALADTSQNVIYTTYPLFLWNTDICNSCQYFIRVAEFDPEIHSSPNEAIEDETVLPIDQSAQWENTYSNSTFQYPPTGSRPLQANNLYAWQVKKSFPTTAGTEEILSAVYVFKIGDASSPATTIAVTNPLLQTLMTAMGSAQYDLVFGPGGPLEDFEPSGTYLLNGATVDETTVSYILSQIAGQNVSVTGARVE